MLTATYRVTTLLVTYLTPLVTLQNHFKQQHIAIYHLEISMVTARAITTQIQA